MKNVRSATLRKYIENQNLRLSKSDREMLADLSKVQILDERDVSNYHYKENKSPASRRLDKLCEAGLLEKHKVYQPGHGKINAYTFKNEKIAGLFGSKYPPIKRKRNALHEVICSKLYFSQGRPESFTLESNFTAEQKALFKQSNKTLIGHDSCIPDAMYLDNGQIVVVEADSGQYNKTQIQSKQAAWRDFKQVWGQPSKAAARVTGAAQVRHF